MFSLSQLRRRLLGALEQALSPTILRSSSGSSNRAAERVSRDDGIFRVNLVEEGDEGMEGGEDETAPSELHSLLNSN